MPATTSPTAAPPAHTDDKPSVSWETRIAELLGTLSTVQGDLLTLLKEKRSALAVGDHQGLAQFSQREAELVERLEACRDQRQQLLDTAADEGLPAENIRSLTDALPARERKALKKPVRQAQQQSRLLQHQSLTNWVVVQRSLLHLSQMMEIIATGGRMQPTYSKDGPALSSGALVDRQA